MYYTVPNCYCQILFTEYLGINRKNIRIFQCLSHIVSEKGEMHLVMSRIFTIMLAVSLFSAFLHGSSQALAASVLQGAQAGVELAISMAGSLCLWSGVGKLLDAATITDRLSKLLKPLLHKVFPSTAKDPAISRSISGNLCANFLGLGNAATPMGIQAAKCLAKGQNGIASKELCRLVVLNTASIQLIPTNVAALRASLGCSAPFDILPSVWLTSFCSAGMGLAAAWLLSKVWPHA